MESELVALFEAVKKAADAATTTEDNGGSESRCLDALKELKNFPVNYQILVSTQVGKRLKHLTKHPKKKIQRVAADLIDLWKNIILQETAQKGGAINVCSTKKQTEKVVEVVSPRPQKLAKTETGAVKRKVEINPVPKLACMIKTNDVVRDKMREMLVEALLKVISEAEGSMKEEIIKGCDPIRVAVEVESVTFENWGRYTGAHKLKYRSVMFNIKDTKNPDFRRKVLVGEIKAERICSLTSDEMASEERRKQKKEIEEKKLFDCERTTAPKATTDQFKCGRCGQRKCTYYQLQTRSADEPMTTFVTCVNCNNHWKFC